MQKNIALTIVLLASTISTPADQLDDYVASQMRAHQIPGVVVVVLKDADIVAQQAYGLSNIEFNVPMKVEDVFTMASVTEPFTTAAIFELVQDGKLRLDDRITTLVPGLPDLWKGITILHSQPYQWPNRSLRGHP